MSLRPIKVSKKIDQEKDVPATGADADFAVWIQKRRASHMTKEADVEGKGLDVLVWDSKNGRNLLNEHVEMKTTREAFVHFLNQRDMNKKSCVHILSVFFYILIFLTTISYDFDVKSTMSAELPLIKMGEDAESSF
jgi:hypothetical protein